MIDFPLNSNVAMEEIQIEDIPGYCFRPKNLAAPYPSIVFYHGWQSNAQRQRFRAGLLASFGYQVFIVDGPFHGQRGAIADTPENVAAYFWRTIDLEVDEFQLLRKAIVHQYGADPERLAVMGHSMGALISLALMTVYPDIVCSVAYNGASDWQWLEDNMASRWHTTMTAIRERRSSLGNISYYSSRYNPWQDRTKLLERPLLLTNGEEDKTIPYAANLRLADYLKQHNTDSDYFHHEIYEGVGHLVTDRMLADGISFLKRHL